ncbi:hypothetical protein ACLE20_04870 [Rhizobium sp. YIM 134829]|uniref:hypothetical protein n=1 Tax=Rhizobium sp. YIM 134829 TaxID=3390453 RepID=UPI003978B30D
MAGDRVDLEKAHGLGRAAGSIREAQALECPFLHDNADERRAWMDGFSSGRVELSMGSYQTQEGSSLHVDEGLRRPMPFGSRVVFHHSTRSIAIDFQGETRVLGPFADEDAAYAAAFALVETRRAALGN